MSFLVDGELRKSQLVDRNGLWPTPVEVGLDMRRRLPGLLGRFGGNVCGHCQPLVEEAS